MIDVKTAQSLIADGDPVILDVREKNEFNLGHIEHAINLPRGEIRSDIESILATRHKDAPILIYCASGHRSVLAALVMAEIGYTNVISLTGGYVKWKREMS